MKGWRMMNFEREAEVLKSDFSIETHKETFVNYLEVIIKEDGTIIYAVPSHQLCALDLITQATGETREAVGDRCPEEYYYDFNKWLCEESGVIMVYNNGYTGVANEAQIVKLVELAEAGLYYGSIDVDFLERR